MAEETSATCESASPGTGSNDNNDNNSNGNNNGVTLDNPSTKPPLFLAPSDFLPALPPSTEPPHSPSNGDGASVDDAPAPEVSLSVAPTKPLRDAQGRMLNPRSCVTCRKRKVKCDKLHPCSNCNRAHIECVFPAPGRAPRKIRKIGEGRDKELLERLRRLEGVVKGMGVEVPGGKESQDTTSPRRPGADPPVRRESGGQEHAEQEHADDAGAAQQGEAEDDFQRKTRLADHRGSFENKFGRLVVNEGKSRYINNSFWANLSNEVEDLKGILNQSSDEEDITPSPGANAAPMPSNHHGFIFGLSSQSADLLNLHPLPGQISDYWDIYKDRVDPLVKVLHIPTLEPTVLSAASHLSNLSRGFECLLFALYYGATTSLSAHDCLLKLGEEKPVLLVRYRFAIEQALARANFLVTEELVVLQAFVIFLICLRRNNDARVIWTLTGLVVRIAQTIGIHRDGSHFGLSAFEIEMRRRLWWQVCILDTRASEDHGCDPTIVEQSFDTKMPLNIHDSDISPGTKEYPKEVQGCTDMSFCLLRFEVSNTFRRLNYVPPGPPKACGEFYSSVTLQDKERWITECHQRLEDRYLKHCDMSVPLYWVTATVARLMMSKMWLMVYHPFQRQNSGATLSAETKEKLFITSLENMEYSLLLETEARTMKWGWLFKTYVQWHALAYTLSELRYRTTGEMVERAWAAVEKTGDGRWGAHFSDEMNTGHLWRPLKKLYRKAKEERQRGLQEEGVTKQTNVSTTPIRTYSPNEHPMFGRPGRARVTRAPLSDAQLKRFTDGPTFGQTPLDKHELLRSPRPSETSGDDPMDTAGLPADLPQQSTAVRDTTHDFMAGQTQSTNGMVYPVTTNNGQPLVAPQAQQPSMQQLQQRRQHQHSMMFGQNFLSSANKIDFDDPMLQMNNSDTTNYRSAVRTNSLDDNNDFMDTSGDLNWENWDQLVRQFELDTDAGNTTNLNGPNWETGNTAATAGGQNLRMGMGMGGGDWF